jgi:hypothetical protein
VLDYALAFCRSCKHGTQSKAQFTDFLSKSQTLCITWRYSHGNTGADFGFALTLIFCLLGYGEHLNILQHREGYIPGFTDSAGCDNNVHLVSGFDKPCNTHNLIYRDSHCSHVTRNGSYEADPLTFPIQPVHEDLLAFKDFVFRYQPQNIGHIPHNIGMGRFFRDLLDID